jgi:hypothetical protein
MNVIFYAMAIIILILIIGFISLKYYLSKKYLINAIIDDSNALNNNCLNSHNINIIYCKYLVNGKKYNVTNQIKKQLKFNAAILNLPPNGKFKIGYVCYNCSDKIQKKHNFTNLAGIGGDSISIPNNTSYNGNYFSTNALQKIYNNNTKKYNIIQHTPKLNIKKINENIKTNNIDLLLNRVKEEENKQNPHYINDTPFSSYVNIFSRKYPALSATNILGGYIDPEFIPDGLYGSAKLLNEVITN